MNPSSSSSVAEAPRGAYRWYHKLFALVFIVFCLELGVILLVLPWSEYWDNNFFSNWAPGWHDLWKNEYLRGAISGLGIVNIYISFSELFRMRRFHPAGADEEHDS
ncbi:MAG: hypothetical protein IPM24_11480 [Bryobacterales bacterium]|nr:hypothetical protein [Bryobacterales bacterium]